MAHAAAYSVLEVEGSAYECGYTYGQKASANVASSVDVYLRLAAHHAGLARSQALALSAQFLAPIQAYLPELEQELRGLADGAGISFEEILFLNCRTEVLSTVPLHECTAVAAVPPATHPPNVLLGQTWDWLQATHDLPLLLKIRQVGKPEVITLVEAGQLGKIGMNETGFGLCLNWLEADHRSLGVPVHLLCRAMLNQHSVMEAMNLLFRVPRGSAANYMFASNCGFAVALETTPSAIGTIEPEAGLLVHTNHFLAHHLQPHDRGLLREGADSLIRRQRALALLQPAHGSIDRTSLEDLQSDTQCAPGSISQAPTESLPPLEDYATLAGVIMDLTRMQAHLATGRPSAGAYVKIYG